MSTNNWENEDFYRDLNIAPNASSREIRSAYRKLVREFHPDVNSDADRGEKFRKISDAYAILGDEVQRKNYDDFKAIYSEPSRDGRKLGSNWARFSARTAVFVLLLLFLKNMGLVALPQGQVNSSTSKSASGSQSDSKNGNLNQVLALMVGPQGPPGPAGVAGKNGFIGLNGYTGKDGINGAPGAVGEQGPIGPAGPQGATGANGSSGSSGSNGTNGVSVAVVTLSSNSSASNYDSNCPNGGTKFVLTDGTYSYACNGSGGGGGGSGGSTSLGLGYTQVGTCDSSVKISLDSAYRSIYESGSPTQDFTMDAIVLDQLAGACNGQTLTAILQINSGSIYGGANASGVTTYYAGDAIECDMTLSLDPTSGDDANSVSLTYPDCYNRTHPSSAFRLYDVVSRDVSTASNGLVIQIA